jgi:anti-sigma regulatory factor (Ser/Thr protein kinase)
MGNLLSRRPIAERSSEGKSPILRKEVVLPVNQFAALLARNALDDAIPPPPLNGRSDDPRLAVTELVSNAVRHAGLETDTLIHLRIEADDAHVRVEVEQPTSASDVHVAEQPGTDERPGGFGLRLVEVFADAWGFEPGPPGRVWFEFRP